MLDAFFNMRLQKVERFLLGYHRKFTLDKDLTCSSSSEDQDVNKLPSLMESVKVQKVG